MLILLDIDGVMIPAKIWKVPTLLEDGFPEFSLEAVKALNFLISNDSEIILTTSHRFNYTIEEWCKIFQKRGVKKVNINIIESKTEKRIDLIANWLSKNNIKDYIIIDDDNFLNNLKDRKNLILTQSSVGLKMSDIK